MNKEFSINCGDKNIFEVSKRKYCAGCGSPFNTSSVSKYKQVEEIEEEQYDSPSFDINKLKASIIEEQTKNALKEAEDGLIVPPEENSDAKEPSETPYDEIFS